MLKKLGHEGLTLNAEKYAFTMGRILFLGHRVITDGLTANEGRVRIIMEMPELKDVEGVKTVMGMASPPKHRLSV